MSLSDIADMEGVTERTMQRRIDSARYPAPTRVTKKGPQWDARTVGAFADGTHPVFHPEHAAPGYTWFASVLDEVRWWVWKHGTATIPTSAAGRCVGAQRSRIGPRVTKVRAAYRDGTMPPEMQRAFEALPGWVWDAKSSAWQARLDDVLTRWPTRLSGSDKAWLASQRARLGRLPAARAEALRAVPGLLDYRGNRRVREFVEAVMVWMDENPGTTAADLTYTATAQVDGATVPVGRRAGYYRRRYLGKESALPMSREDQDLIESLSGWSWQQSPRHVAAASSS